MTFTGLPIGYYPQTGGYLPVAASGTAQKRPFTYNYSLQRSPPSSDTAYRMTVIYQLPLQVLLRGSHLPITAAFTGGSTYQTALDTAYDRLLPKCKHLDLRYGVSHTSSETSMG